jgi:hypothetical protein
MLDIRAAVVSDVGLLVAWWPVQEKRVSFNHSQGSEGATMPVQLRGRVGLVAVPDELLGEVCRGRCAPGRSSVEGVREISFLVCHRK